MASEPPLPSLSTELPNPATSTIDSLTSLDLVTLINSQDAHVIECIKPVLPDVSRAIDNIVPRVRKGGRVIYFGAGTSGRLGVLDASECMPTFNCDQFIGIMAGGDDAIRNAKEDVEDLESAGEADLIQIKLDPERDVAVGLTASGRTPYVLGGLRYAHSIGCLTIGVTCTSPSAMSLAQFIDILISPISGPEVVTGSTRLKAGTTTKLILNMLSTCSLIRCGKTFGNLMVDLRVSNIKLQARGRGIIRAVNKEGVYMPSSSVLDTEPSNDTLDSLVTQCDGSVKLAIIVGRTGWSVQRALTELEAQQGILAQVLHFATLSRSIIPPSTTIFNLCVDGGGTSTRVILSSPTGNILARGISGPSNVSTIGIEGSLMSLRVALTKALDNLSSPLPLARVRFNRAWVGHAGLDPNSRPTVYNAYVEKLEALLSLQLGDRLKVTSDAELLTASLLSKPQKQGVVLVAGTGSVCMLFLPNGETGSLELVNRLGGLGYLLGDEGSAYSIGRQAIRRALYPPSSDGKILAEEVTKFLGIQSVGDLIPLVYKDANSSKSLIASVSPTVLALFEKGNLCAEAIVREAVEHLTDMVLQVVPETAGSEMAVCVTGGLTESEGFRRVFVRQMAERKVELGNIYWVDDPVVVACRGL